LVAAIVASAAAVVAVVGTGWLVGAETAEEAVVGEAAGGAPQPASTMAAANNIPNLLVIDIESPPFFHQSLLQI
jgi:hypothetical protein